MALRLLSWNNFILLRMIFVSCCWQVWFSWQGGLEEVPRICNLQILQIQRTVGRSARNWLVFYNVQRKELSSTSFMKTATSRQPNLKEEKNPLRSDPSQPLGVFLLTIRVPPKKINSVNMSQNYPFLLSISGSFTSGALTTLCSNLPSLPITY